MSNDYAASSARNLSLQSSNLAQHLSLINGQSGLPGMDAATEVTKHLAHVQEQVGLHTLMLAEYVRAQCEAGNVEPHPGLGGLKEVDVTEHKGLIFLGARSVVAAGDASARALSGMHELMQELATRPNLPERIGVDPAMRSKGFAMNLLHAATLGDYPTVQTLAERMSADDAADLIAMLKAVAGYVGAPHGFNAPSPVEQPDG